MPSSFGGRWAECLAGRSAATRLIVANRYPISNYTGSIGFGCSSRDDGWDSHGGQWSDSAAEESPVMGQEEQRGVLGLIGWCSASWPPCPLALLCKLVAGASKGAESNGLG